MRCFHWIKLIARVCALLAVCAAQTEAAEFELQCASDDKFLQVYSDHDIEPVRCKAIGERVLKAYAFIGKTAAWKDQGILKANPLQFRLLGGNLKVLGYAQGPNLMVMKDDYLDKPLSEGTLAHEPTHIQDLRQLKGKRLPSFMLEGRALTIGKAYRVFLGQEPNTYDHQMAGSAMKFTSAQAEALLNEYRGQGWNNQAIGTVLVEYMRTKMNGSGIADINMRLSRIIEIMAAGAEFEAAFEKEFGVSALVVGEAFMKHLDATQGKPSARLQGTIWQATSPSDSTEDEDD